MVDLGTIEMVDLREIWPDEARQFTPWLADNLDQLGEVLGLDLELSGQEVGIGDFALDVLAYDTGSNRVVVIENQLERTDHSHLGQLLTYAAGHDAGAVVWLARDFREEHIASLDWLNQRTGEDTAFFGVVVEVWRIDDSRPAPNFRLVAIPNDWRKRKRSAALAGGVPVVSEQMQRRREFHRGIIEAVEGELRLTGLANTIPSQWLSFSSGVAGVRYGANIYKYSGTANVEFTIDRRDKEWNKRFFDRLTERKEEIESQLEHALEWDRLDDYRSACITVKRTASIDDGYEALEHHQRWMIDNLLSFKRVFEPHLAAMQE